MTRSFGVLFSDTVSVSVIVDIETIEPTATSLGRWYGRVSPQDRQITPMNQLLIETDTIWLRLNDGRLGAVLLQSDIFADVASGNRLEFYSFIGVGELKTA